MGPDNYWFGARPQKLVDLRGAGVDQVIARIDAAGAGYPYAASYRTWPGPNSNTFTAWVGRQVPELRLRLPPTAIGKDYLPGGALAGTTPSSQPIARPPRPKSESWTPVPLGVELNLLTLNFGV